MIVLYTGIFISMGSYTLDAAIRLAMSYIVVWIIEGWVERKWWYGLIYIMQIFIYFTLQLILLAIDLRLQYVGPKSYN